MCSFAISCNVTIGEIHAVVGADVAVTATRERGEVTDVLRLVFGDVAYTVPFTGDYFDGFFVVGIGGFWFQVGNELTQVVVYMFAVGDACNVEFDVVYTLKSLILGPDADVVAFVLDAEILELMDGGVFTVWGTDGHSGRWG